MLETGFNIGQSAAMILTTLSLAGVDTPSCVVAALEAPRDGYPPPPLSFGRTSEESDQSYAIATAGDRQVER